MRLFSLSTTCRSPSISQWTAVGQIDWFCGLLLENELPCSCVQNNLGVLLISGLFYSVSVQRCGVPYSNVCSLQWRLAQLLFCQSPGSSGKTRWTPAIFIQEVHSSITQEVFFLDIAARDKTFFRDFRNGEETTSLVSSAVLLHIELKDKEWTTALPYLQREKISHIEYFLILLKDNNFAFFSLFQQKKFAFISAVTLLHVFLFSVDCAILFWCETLHSRHIFAAE